MPIYIPSKNDVSINILPKSGVEPSTEVRLAIAKRLIALYENKNLVNLRRNIPICSICDDQCTYIDENCIERRLAACSIYYKGDTISMLIPVQVIHLLEKHKNPIDPALLMLLS